MKIVLKNPPVLEPDFVPAVLWNRAYREQVAREPDARPLELALLRPDGVCFRQSLRVLPHRDPYAAWNRTYVERAVKTLLWQKGGSTLLVAGSRPVADALAARYAPDGGRAFDEEIFGRKIFPGGFSVTPTDFAEMPEERAPAVALGGHLEGCRIGFDLGGSDRKCAAVIDGEVVFSEEIAWNPYFEKDPRYHRDGVVDTLRRAASHLPRVDAIGGSAAGVYVNNEVRVASLFRGVSPEDFERHVRRMFLELGREWAVPFEVVNDGEVTALAGSRSLRDGALLGVSMGTSQAAGYCDAGRRITCWLNELAFTPVDYRADAPADEWSGDVGCGVQYFSQQGVARLAARAGIEFAPDVPLAERLAAVQDRLKAGDPAARKVFETIGTCFGYALGHYAEGYEIRNVLILGRVTSGAGGEIILAKAREVIDAEFPEWGSGLRLTTPDEKMKRHGQAVAAASLPALPTRPGGGGARA